MKCPKCGYNSFDYLDSCKKCGKDLIEHKQKFGIVSVLFPGQMSPVGKSATAEDENVVAEAVAAATATVAAGAAAVAGVDAADVNELIFQGADFHYKGKLDQATDKFEAAVSLDPSNEFAHNQLGILYAKKNRFDKAFNQFTIVTGLDQRNTFAQLWLGIIHLKNKDMNQAFERFQRIIQIDPNNADAYYFIGAIYNFRHNPAMAIEFLKKARIPSKARIKINKKKFIKMN